MLSLLPPSPRPVHDPAAFAVIDVDALLTITDPWHRSRAAAEQAKALESQVAALLQIRRDAVGELVNQHRTPLSKVASHLGLTRQRISQLAHAALRALDGGDAR
jgi:predicted XRE-type DNA-binding protein